MRKLPTVRTALKHVVETLIPNGQGYIVNIESQDFPTPKIQVVAQGMVDRSHDCGLTVHLPFDIDSGQNENFMRFMEVDLSVELQQKDVDGIPCYYANSARITSMPIE